MYRLATKCTTKNELRNAISVYGFRLHVCMGVERHGSFVNNDTQRAVTVP